MPQQSLASREMASLLGVLAHPHRIRIVEELRAGELDVNSLQSILGGKPFAGIAAPVGVAFAPDCGGAAGRPARFLPAAARWLGEVAGERPGICGARAAVGPGHSRGGGCEPGDLVGGDRAGERRVTERTLGRLGEMGVGFPRIRVSGWYSSVRFPEKAVSTTLEEYPKMLRSLYLITGTGVSLLAADLSANAEVFGEGGGWAMAAIGAALVLQRRIRRG